MLTFAATTVLTAATYGDFLVGLILVAVFALVIITTGYLTRCWLFPFTTCHHSVRYAWRCRRCQGTGLRLRAGRRLINHLTDARRRYHR
jgi:hypothetical protein